MDTPGSHLTDIAMPLSDHDVNAAITNAHRYARCDIATGEMTLLVLLHVLSLRKGVNPKTPLIRSEPPLEDHASHGIRR